MISEKIEAIRPETMVGIFPDALINDPSFKGFEWAYVQYTYYWAVCRLLRPKKIMEIGVLSGSSLAAMLMGAGPDANAIGWDIEGYRPGSNEWAMRNLGLCGVGHQVKLENVDSQKVSELPEGIDLIHIDGAHWKEGALHDLELASRAGIRYILFDDINNTSIPDCRAAIEEFIDSEAIMWFEPLPTHTGLMVIEMDVKNG